MKIGRFFVPILLFLSAMSPCRARAGVLQTLYKFNGADGQGPQASLVPDGQGNFLGTTANGGTYGAGTVFQLTTNGDVFPVACFDSTNGANPFGHLMLSGGVIYGTTANGGPVNHGTVYKIASNAPVTLVAFSNSITDGAFPYAGLVDGGDNEFFGTTSGGGDHSVGMVFKLYSSDASETPLVSFNTLDGFAPEAGLILNTNNGYFYGTTSGGGTNSDGTVFKVSFTGIFHPFFSFSGTNGQSPWSQLVFGPDGNLYGTSVYGGPNSYGTIYEVNATNDAVKMLAWFSYTNGANPYAELTLGSGGNLYGVTRLGGTGNYGTIFRLGTDGALERLYSFDYAHGAEPWGAMVFGNDGNLYGTTLNGGTGSGTIFRFILNPPAPRFLSVAKTNANVTLTLSTVSGGNYQLQYKTNLLQASWSNLGLANLATNSTILALDTAPPDAQRFYRAMLLQ